MNCLVCRCLNLGGPFLGVTGPPVTLVADRISALGGSRFMARLAETPRRPLASRLPHAVGCGHTRLGGSWSAPLLPPPLQVSTQQNRGSPETGNPGGPEHDPNSSPLPSPRGAPAGVRRGMRVPVAPWCTPLRCLPFCVSRLNPWGSGHWASFLEAGQAPSSGNEG